MEIYLNGNKYVLAGGTGIKRTPLAEWPENTRLDGQQLRKDRRLLSSWVIDSWVSGLGRQEANVATASDLSSLWDAENVDTRIDGQIPLSPAFNTCTIVPSRADLDHQLKFLDNLYFVESGRPSLPGYAYQFTPPFTIGSFRLVANPGVRGPGNAFNMGSTSGIINIGNNIAFLGRGQSTTSIGFAYAPTMGGSYNSPFYIDNINLTRFSQMAELGGTPHILGYRESENKVGFWVANQNLGSLTLVASISAVIGTYLSPMVTDGLTMWAALPQGIYDFDATPAISIDTGRAQDLNPNLVLFQNYLHFKNKKSTMRYDGTNITSVGYDRRDGLVSEKMGEITAWASSWEHIYAAVKGLTYSHILTFNGSAWQYYARIPSPNLWVRNMFFSDAPDAIDRLWIMYGNYGYHGYFLNPLINPLQAATYSYVPTGHVTPPRYGGDLPEEAGGFFDQVITGDALGGGNLIDCFYGLNGVALTTSLGQVSSTTQALTYGSPAGLEGYRIQPQFNLAGSATGTTPVFRQAVIHYLKKPDLREVFDFTIDLDKTASDVNSPEAIIGSLTYEANIKTLLPFHYGQIATRQVMILDMPATEETEGGRIIEGERTGQIQIRVAEIL